MVVGSKEDYDTMVAAVSSAPFAAPVPVASPVAPEASAAQ
jgi:hypothetical protein